jgi:hypothetical protein
MGRCQVQRCNNLGAPILQAVAHWKWLSQFQYLTPFTCPEHRGTNILPVNLTACITSNRRHARPLLQL